MLHQVEAGLGGVVTQRAVIDARVWTVRAVLLLQVLRIRGDVFQGVQGSNQATFVSHTYAVTEISSSFVIYGYRTFLSRILVCFKSG